QSGLYEHFKAIAMETTLPVMLYNIPSRSAVKMDAETIIQLSQLDNIVSVKEASGDLDQVAEIIEKTDDQFTVYSGDDSSALPILTIGREGVVSVATLIIGSKKQAMVKAVDAADVQKAAAIHRQLLPMMKGLFQTN